MIFKAEVHIMPRKTVLDTQGKAVEKTLIHLGYTSLKEANVGKIVNIRLDAESADSAKKSVESMCQDLLVNELTETFDIIIEASCK